MGNGWRTLTKDEWVYVFDKRITGSGIRYAKATVNGVNGIILLPDEWNSSTYKLKNINTPDAKYTNNKINTTDWNSTLAPAGAVFLPVCGCRIGTSVSNVGSYGNYWSASPIGSNAKYVYIAGGHFTASLFEKRHFGMSVRLVCPAN